jgi:alpha-amylase
MNVNLCFQIQHPLKLKKIDSSKVSKNMRLKSSIFDQSLNRKSFAELQEKVYLPTLRALDESVTTFMKQKRKFMFSLNVSGTFLDYCRRNGETMDLLKKLSDSGCVEFMGSTYYHSLAGLMDEKEFKSQVSLHTRKIKKLFGQEPTNFVNTELIFDDSISDQVKDLGFDSMLTEGNEKVLGWRSPNFIYMAKNGLKVMLRNKGLSDDIALRFSSVGWNEWPLTAEKYSYWLSKSSGECINLYLDIRNFGQYHDEQSGIFWFLKALPWKVFDNRNLQFSKPSEILKTHHVGEIRLPDNEILSWSGLCPVNDIQRKYLDELKDLGVIIKDINNPTMTSTWRLLQMVESYRNEYGLHNLSDIIDFFRKTASRNIKKTKESPEKEPSDKELPVKEESLFSVDALDTYFTDRMSSLESVSESLKSRVAS